MAEEKQKQKTVHDLSVSELAEFLTAGAKAAEGQGASHMVLHVEVVKRLAAELVALQRAVESHGPMST